MKTHVVYVLSHDDYLIEFWHKIENPQWQVIPIRKTDDLLHLAAGQLVLVDIALINNDKLTDWQTAFAAHKLLVASLKPNDIEGQQVLVYGAQAYAQAYSSAGVWRQILAHVQQGHVWIGESLLSRLLSQMTKTLSEQSQWQADLTDREIDVAQRVALGHPNRLIAEDLSIPDRTVRAHLGSVFAKLDVSDRLMLALKIHGLS